MGLATPVYEEMTAGKANNTIDVKSEIANIQLTILLPVLPRNQKFMSQDLSQSEKSLLVQHNIYEK
jgi:hypothetical protein